MNRPDPTPEEVRPPRPARHAHFECGELAPRGPASFLFEDLLVASARFAMARRRTVIQRSGRRPVRSRSKAAGADLDHHRRMLADVTRWLTEAGGDPRGEGLSTADLRCARRTAAARLRNGDGAHGRCQCSAACGRPWPVARPASAS